MGKSRQWTSIALAIVMPMLVVTAGLIGLESFRTSSDERENRNAGKVINGTVVQGGVVSMIERSLAANQPEVVILGNSLSNTDILPALLAKRLGIRKNKIQRYSIPNSIGAHWYLVLKNRIYANGHQPRLVIMLSDMQSALAVTPRSEASYLNLSVHMNRNEPVINRKLGERSYYLERVRQNRGKLREKALEGARNAMVDLLYHRSFEPTDSRVTEKALERVFDASKTDMRLHNNVIPIFSQKGKLQPFDPSTLPLPKASFIPEITKLVAANNGTAVFLRPPMSPLLPEQLGDLVLPEVEPKVISLVDRLGGRYLDTRALPLEATHFHNVDHMNPEGARHYTEAVARVLWETPGLEAWRPRKGVEIDLLRIVDVEEGVAFPHFPDVDYKKPPLPVPLGKKPFQRGRKSLAYFETEHLHFLSDAATADANPAARRCSPIRVLEDGEPLPIGNVSCEETLRHRRGRYCHTNDRVYFSASDDTSPFDNERSYELALDPERRCWGSQWLYPGDHMRLRPDEGDLDRFAEGARALTLRGTSATGKGDAAKPVFLTVKIWVNNKVRIEERVPASAFDTDDGYTFRLTPGLGRLADLVVEVRNDSDSFVLLTAARLNDKAPRG